MTSERHRFLQRDRARHLLPPRPRRRRYFAAALRAALADIAQSGNCGVQHEQDADPGRGDASLLDNARESYAFLRSLGMAVVSQGGEMNTACIVDCRNTLGEGCVRDPRDGASGRTDIEESRIYRLAPGSIRSPPSRFRASCFYPAVRSRARVRGSALPCHLAVADPDLPSFRLARRRTWTGPKTPWNDAAVDPFGGIVFGTFDERDRQPAASLYRLSPDGTLRSALGRHHRSATGMACSRWGISYFADTPAGVIRRFRIGLNFSSIDEIDALAGL